MIHETEGLIGKEVYQTFNALLAQIGLYP